MVWLYGLHMSVCTGIFSHTCTGYWRAPVGCDHTPRDAWLDSWWTGWSHTWATWGPNPEPTVPSDSLTMGLRSLRAPRTPPAHTGKSVHPSRDGQSLTHCQTAHAGKLWRQQNSAMVSAINTPFGFWLFVRLQNKSKLIWLRFSEFLFLWKVCTCLLDHRRCCSMSATLGFTTTCLELCSPLHSHELLNQPDMYHYAVSMQAETQTNTEFQLP